MRPSACLLGMLLFFAFGACGGSGGSGGSSNDGLPTSCVEVGSINNTGGGAVIIVANCVSGTGNVTQNCFATGPGGENPVPVPCDNGGSGQTVGSATPVA